MGKFTLDVTQKGGRKEFGFCFGGNYVNKTMAISAAFFLLCFWKQKMKLGPSKQAVSASLSSTADGLLFPSFFPKIGSLPILMINLSVFTVSFLTFDPGDKSLSC